MTDKLDGRRPHVWSGTDREKDTAALVEAIVVGVPRLCSLDGSIAQLDGAGGLSAVNLTTFRELIQKYVCGVRIVRNGSGWAYDYYSYAFLPKPRFNPTNANPTPDAGWSREPDAGVLDAIYRTELVRRLPRVVT
jgi:hypothetical protein